MDNLVLTTEFDLNVLNQMKYGQLRIFVKYLDKVISELTKIKFNLVLSNSDYEAVECEKQINYATINKNSMLVVMLNKEGELCEHSSIETIWLN